jgi:hypothetical protein
MNPAPQPEVTPIRKRRRLHVETDADPTPFWPAPLSDATSARSAPPPEGVSAPARIPVAHTDVGRARGAALLARHAGRERSERGGAVSPLLDTTGTSCTPRPKLYVGGAWAAQFREDIAEALTAHWPKRAKAMRACGRDAVHLACKCCTTSHLVPFRCGARTCPTCARLAAAAIADRISGRVTVHDEIMAHEPWDGPGRAQQRGWRMVTLTARADEDVDARFDRHALRRLVARVRRAFPQFWRRTDWGRQTRDESSRRKRSRRDTSYIFALEVSPRGMVHVHALVYGEYISQASLTRTWSQVLGEAALVDVRRVRHDGGVAGALREVLKYATKGEKGVREQPIRAAAVEFALQNVHRVGLGGAIRRIRIADSSGATEDARPEDLHATKVAACESCGVIGEWRWAGRVSEGIVSNNRGFGIVRAGILVSLGEASGSG